MPRWFGRRRLPADKRPALDPDERLLAWATVADDNVIVVTNLGVWLPPGPARLGWHEIHKATWSGRQLALVPAEEVDQHPGYAVVVDRPVVVHTLLDPDRVPDQVRTRVTRSIAYTSHHQLPGGGGVRVVARRVPGVDGLRWTARFDTGTDPAGEQVHDMTAELVAQGRASLPAGLG